MEALYLEWALEWSYEAGTVIEAVAYGEGGNEIARDRVVTAGKAAKIKLAPEETEITADGRDLCYIEVDITDEDGKGVDTATYIIFKGPSYNTNLNNFKLVSLTVSKEGEKEAPADTAPADDAETEPASDSEAPADTSAEEPEASPDTGVEFMLIPAAVSMATVVFGKKRS